MSSNQAHLLKDCFLLSWNDTEMKFFCSDELLYTTASTLHISQKEFFRQFKIHYKINPSSTSDIVKAIYKVRALSFPNEFGQGTYTGIQYNCRTMDPTKE